MRESSRDAVRESVSESSREALRKPLRKLWPGLLAIAASAVFAALMYSHLPERVVSHWGIDGTPNGWMSRAAFVGGMLSIELAVGVLMAFVPRIDPRRDNFKAHAGAYWLVVNSSLVLVAVAMSLAIGANLGWHINFGWMNYGLALLFIAIGNVTTRIRPNWIFGVRTRWTLSSDRSWRETHRVAGYGMVILGVVLLVLAATLPDMFNFVLLPSVIAVVVVSVVRSYFVWLADPTVAHP